MRGEINSERDEAGHNAPPGSGRVAGVGVDAKITALVILGRHTEIERRSVPVVQLGTGNLRGVPDLTVSFAVRAPPTRRKARARHAGGVAYRSTQIAPSV